MRQSVMVRANWACLLLAGVCDAPNASRAVVRDIERSIAACSNTNRTAPDLTVFGYESSEKVFITSIGVAIVHGNPDDLVTGASGAVPGAVLGGKGVAVVLPGKDA